ncbi:hypothetical protein AMATHDRAFT_8785 [Amanita thiersii Skay4041]|uniref:DUF6534 domain-containing protein n=1 Tax=Amanita thiersii Skay4041 TaxID=703135 RepID=A0A2A9NDJ6_9AGAR|nr:hypothetical protein AMATHDRAFT_8785 [Amanita thiersii Skay4041]
MDSHIYEESKDFLFAAVALNLTLYGVLVVQTYLYYLAFSHDRTWIKAAAYVVFALETLHTTMLTWGYHSFTSSDWGFCSGLDCNVQLAMIWVIPLVGGLVALITNVIYAYRIHIVTQSRILFSVLLVFIISQFAAAVIFRVMPSKHYPIHSTSPVTPVQLYYQADVLIPVFGFVWLGLSAICDVAIAAIMVYILSRERMLSKETRWRVSRVIRLVIETGTTTATVDILTLILLVTAKWTVSGYIVPMIILSKAYGNAMMVLLNNRMTIIGSRLRSPTHMDAAATHLSTLRFPTVDQESELASQHTNINEPQKGLPLMEKLSLTSTSE